MSTTNNISFEELANNITNIFNSVRAEHKTVVVEYANGEKLVIKPLSKMRSRSIHNRKRTKADYEAFRSSAGSWSDVDTDALIKRIYESRTISTRPPVIL